jgi:hypothetical protein
MSVYQNFLIYKAFIPLPKNYTVAGRSLFDRMKEKWGIQSNLDLVAILIVFAINGSLAAWVANPITEFFGLDRATTNGWIYWPVRILLIFPIYQLTLPLIGWCFGQFKFFWAFEKKMLERMTGKSRKNKKA